MSVTKTEIQEVLSTLKGELIPLLLNELVPLLRASIQKNEALLNRVVQPAATPPKPDLSLLTEKQKEVFAKIDRVPGNDSSARRKVQSILNQLKGETVTEALGRLLSQTLRNRGWSVKCSCGQAASYLWQRNASCAQGGILVVAHRTGGRQCIHDSCTTYSPHSLIKKVDRRKSVPS